MHPKRQILTESVVLKAKTMAGRFIDHDGSAPAAGGTALGVTQSDGEIGDRVPVTTLGTVPVIASAAVAVGDGVEVLADGRVKKLTAGKTMVARARTAAAAADDEILAYLIPN